MEFLKEEPSCSSDMDLFIDSSGDSAAIIYGGDVIDSIWLYGPHTKYHGRVLSRDKTKTIK